LLQTFERGVLGCFTALRDSGSNGWIDKMMIVESLRLSGALGGALDAALLFGRWGRGSE